MATRLAETRSDRLVVLMSKGEKTLLMARAKAADMTVSDFVRSATERFETEEEMPEELQAELLRQIDEVKERMRVTFEELDAYVAERREPDGAAARAKVFAELEAADVDWDHVRGVLGLGR